MPAENAEFSKAQQLHARTNEDWRLEVFDETWDGNKVAHFSLKGGPPLPPALKSSFKSDKFQADIWVGQISGKAVCLQEGMTNLTQHSSITARRERLNNLGLPTVWTLSEVRADSSFDIKRVVFKNIEVNSTFTDEEVFAPPVFPPDYFVSDVTSGTGVLLQNPHPEIPVRKSDLPLPR